jgi:polyvinyl alcohol dehydrogenase (cytochrome)
MGADDARLYAPVSDLGLLLGFAGGAGPAPKPGLYGLDPATGKILWATPSPEAPCHYARDKTKPSNCVRAQSAAPAVMPGVVFSGTLDGWLRAYDSKTGKILWAYSTTAQTYDTVNGITGQPGGGIDGMGPTIAGGMVFTMSGFNGASRVGSNGVNVLLAFGKD